MRRLRTLPVAVAVVAALVLGACTESDLRLNAPDGLVVPEDDLDPALASSDQVVALALEDLQQFWSEELQARYGVSFQPLRGGLVPYGPDSDVPQCGPNPLRYEDIAANALYCPDEDLIAWDRVELMPELQAEFGPLTVGVVMAHEFAHAIQARAGVEGQTVTLELQADCFAGVWAADASERLAVFGTGGDALDNAMGGFLELRDTIGVAAFDPSAHGSGFDRISAFQEGFEAGSGACAGYEADPPDVVAIPFGSVTDLRNQGNLPISQLVEPLLLDLESFYADLFADLGEAWDPVDGLETADPGTSDVRCGTEEVSPSDLEQASIYCVPDDTIFLSTDLVPALEAIGDFAFGGEVARQYAFAAQERLGVDDARQPALHADCLTGVFSAAEFDRTIPSQELVLSPGDLDEILIAFLSLGGGDEPPAFERAAAFRTGFVDGNAGCGTFLAA